MKTIDWLPSEPMSVQQCLEFGRDPDIIERCASILGIQPTPRQHVVLLHIGPGSTTLYPVYDPDRSGWVAIVKGPASEIIQRSGKCMNRAKEFIESCYPRERLTVLQRVDPGTN